MAATAFGTPINFNANNFLNQQSQSNLFNILQYNNPNSSIIQQQQPSCAQSTSSPSKDTTFTKIFVGGLPYHTTDESLGSFFQKFGNIEEAVVINDRQTGKSRGYGFVSHYMDYYL